ncbi:uncharacterized protein LOC125649582 [Ostrea edulis]|uniref:uncharacterized protein LOC125649582 n=1 Tax=Ostrea edulis TaxID=37623 RepID=UPI0024AF2EBA|nr:uncharacterized protein LOC125649582 [Ostrea edulis]XP_056013932.1 uncharacterized protein LOC125649582 [Ostrea edulis]
MKFASLAMIVCAVASLVDSEDSCEASRGTVTKVYKCPGNETEWIEAAQRKNCTALAGACSEPARFVYHCALNPYVNETLEVCAYGRNIFLGRCTEYSILGNLIQESGESCRMFSNPCPVIYASSEAFKYQDCYALVQRPTTSQPTTSSSVQALTTAINKVTDKTMVNTSIGGFTTPENTTEGSKKKEFGDSTLQRVVLITVSLLVGSCVLSLVSVIIYLLRRKRHEPIPVTPMSQRGGSCTDGSDNISMAAVHFKPVADEGASFTLPSGKVPADRKRDQRMDTFEDPDYEVNERQPLIRKDVLEKLDDQVEKFMKEKSIRNPEDDTELPKTLMDLYENGAEDYSDEIIPFIEECIQKVVEVNNYFKKQKHKSTRIKTEDET